MSCIAGRFFTTEPLGKRSRLQSSPTDKTRSHGPGRGFASQKSALHNPNYSALPMTAPCKCSLSNDESAGLLCIWVFLRPGYICMPAFTTFLLGLSCLWKPWASPLSNGSQGVVCSPINLSVSTYQHPRWCHGSSQLSTWHMCSVTHPFDFL